jgi:hypothetical protein
MNKQYRTGVLNNVGHKIKNGILWSLLSLLKTRNNEMKIRECLPYQISTKPMEWFMGYTWECLMYTRPYYGSIQLKIRIAQQFLAKSPVPDFIICAMVSGMHGKVHLWPYKNQAVLWINMAENRNCLTTFSANLLQWIRRNLSNGTGADTKP